MKIDLNTLLIIGIGLYLFGGKAVQSIGNALGVVGTKFSFAGPKPYGLGFRIMLTVKNDSGVSLPVQGFNGALFTKSGIRLADVFIESNFTLKANELTTIPVVGGVKLESLPELVEKVFKGDFTGELPSFVLKGTLRAGGLNLPVNYTIDSSAYL